MGMGAVQPNPHRPTHKKDDPIPSRQAASLPTAQPHSRASPYMSFVRLFVIRARVLAKSVLIAPFRGTCLQAEGAVKQHAITD